MVHGQDALLYEVLRQLSERNSPDEIAKLAWSILEEKTLWSWISVVGVWNPNGERTIAAAYTGMDSTTLDFSEILDGDRGLICRALASNEPILVNDVHQSAEYLASIADTQSEMTVPFRRSDKLIGWLDLQSSDIHAFSRKDLELAIAIGDILALAFENSFYLQQVEEVTERLRQVDRLKSSFLATMSHEIRTPLSGIVGILDLLLDSEVSEDQTRKLQAMKDSSDVLNRVVNDVLDFSKIEAGQIDILSEAFDLEQLMQQVAELVRPGIEARGLKFKTMIDPAVQGWWKSDPVRISQILLNLLNNAAKFSESGKITLRVDLQGGDDEARVEFTVMDQGIGIASERLSEVFQPFRQLNDQYTRKRGGSGLGLAICQRLAELMGGKISVSSAPGEGTTFSLSLPLKRTHSAEPAISMVRPGGGFAEENPLSILVAEDSPVNQEVILGSLRSLGYEADVADNGREALSLLSSRSYDLILMDVQMPIMDGITATRAIRQHQAQQPYIIAVTAHAFSEDRQRCLDVGMNDYLEKPFKLPELAKKLSTMVNLTRHEYQEQRG